MTRPIRIDGARLIASGLPYVTVYKRLSLGWEEERAYTPREQLCGCGCGGVGTVRVGVRMYCAARAAVLNG